MHADGHMALALIQEAFELAFNAHRTYRDTLRTPCHAIVGSEQLCSSEHIVKVVHGLTLPHKHDIGEGFTLRQSVNLIEYVGCRKTALKSLLARLAEKTVHLASHLR